MFVIEFKMASGPGVIGLKHRWRYSLNGAMRKEMAGMGMERSALHKAMKRYSKARERRPQGQQQAAVQDDQRVLEPAMQRHPYGHAGQLHGLALSGSLPRLAGHAELVSRTDLPGRGVIITPTTRDEKSPPQSSAPASPGSARRANSSRPG